MEGLGNDYVYIDVERFPIAEPAALAMRLSDRHKGVGADGIVLIGRSTMADFKMRIFNADGSEAQMCGNAARCVARYVHDRGLTTKTDLTLETTAGIRRLRIVPAVKSNPAVKSDPKVMVSVNMGPYRAEPLMVTVGNRRFEGYRVDMGNPHFVVFTDAAIEEFGPALERHEAFPERTNVEFARFLDEGRIGMRVWERGSGITMACGTGACATFAAARCAGLELERATVEMDGGALEVALLRAPATALATAPATTLATAPATTLATALATTLATAPATANAETPATTPAELVMTGPAEFVFDGTIEL